MQGSRDRGFLGQFGELMEHVTVFGRIDLPRLGHKNHVSLHVTGCFVMLSMGDLPGEIRDQESRVAEPANSIIQRFARREGLMAAFMGENPQPGTEQALHEGVQSPETSSGCC